MDFGSSSRSRASRRALLTLLGVLLVGALGVGACPFGLDVQAILELKQAGVDKYEGQFTPVLSEDIGMGWTRHTFDPDGGNGPTCIAGTPFTTFTKSGDPDKLLIFLQGGGACWQNFYFCTVLADQFPPPFASDASGIWVDSFDTGSGVVDNPIADYSVVYVPYCDGSVFAGDNELPDPAFQAFIENAFGLPQGAGPTVRSHRGLRNLTAAMDLAKATFPQAHKVLLAGSSAGGVGVAGFAPFVFRLVFGNFRDLFVFNDAGPVAVNLNETAAIQARADDWQFGQFYPASCTECSDVGQPTAAIDWRLDHDGNVAESFWSTDADFTNRFFLNVGSQVEYRDLLLTEHGALHDAHPLRYKRFIKSGSGDHTALQSDRFYTSTIDGVPLYLWTQDFLRRNPFGWRDLVEDLVPFP